MRRILALILVLLLAVAGVWVADTYGWLDKTPLANISSKYPTPLSTSLFRAHQQIAILSDRGAVVGNETGTVLGEFISVNKTQEANQSLHQTALDRARYLYCQGVIDAYEAKQDQN